MLVAREQPGWGTHGRKNIHKRTDENGYKNKLKKQRGSAGAKASSDRRFEPSRNSDDSYREFFFL